MGLAFNPFVLLLDQESAPLFLSIPFFVGWLVGWLVGRGGPVAAAAAVKGVEYKESSRTRRVYSFIHSFIQQQKKWPPLLLLLSYCHYSNRFV